VHHFYASLKQDLQYQKHVTWIGDSPYAIVEYLGTFSDHFVPHGNATYATAEYVRTKKNPTSFCNVIVSWPWIFHAFTSFIPFNSLPFNSPHPSTYDACLTGPPVYSCSLDYWLTRLCAAIIHTASQQSQFHAAALS